MKNKEIIEEAYHLIDLLQMDNDNMKDKRLLSQSQKDEAVKYNNRLIKKLKNSIKELEK